MFCVKSLLRFLSVVVLGDSFDEVGEGQAGYCGDSFSFG